MTTNDTRLARIHRLVDVTRGRGLELGPLYSPLVTRSESDVRYADLHSAAGLRAQYASHPGTPLDDIVDVDFALIHEGRRRSLVEATGGEAAFDWVVASHVIEHVPDVISWLADVAAVLRDGGRLVLAIPDRRFCFDALRPPTTVGAMLQAHLAGETVPSVRAVFDHFTTAVDVTPVGAWPGELRTAQAIHGDAYAWEQVQAARAGIYVDCHVWLWTPESFVAQLGTLAALGLLDLSLAEITPTAMGEIEFFVVLERVPRGLGPDERHTSALAGYTKHAGPTPVVDTEPRTAFFELSPRERGALLLERKLVRGTRRALRSLHWR